MQKRTFDIVKSSGEKVKFSPSKLGRSLKNSGADKSTIDRIINIVQDELYQGISTKEIYNRAFALLKIENSHFASKYKLKKAIYELGPTGFPFEKFVASILTYEGYTTQVSRVLQGKCVEHEIDIIATKNEDITVIECKYHSEQGLNCNIKIPLYIYSRYKDVKEAWNLKSNNSKKIMAGWVVTNTRFTKDALDYGNCMGLGLLSWDYPTYKGLKDRIDKLGLYPITVSNHLSKHEKQLLLNKGLVLCMELLKEPFHLDHLGISEIRKEKILTEISMLCQ